MKSVSLLPALLLAACSAGGLTTVEPGSTFDMVAGQQQPLAERLLDSFGSPLHGQITWTSSNTAAATVDQNGVVTAVRTGTTNVSGISDHSSAAVLITVHQGGMVNQDSGSTYSDDRSFWVTRQAGLFSLGALTFTSLPMPPLPNAISGTAWEIGVGDFALGWNVLATIRYDPTRLPAGTNQRHLQFRALSGAAIGGNFVDTVAHTVTIGASSAGTKLVLVIEPVQVDSLHLTMDYVLHLGNHEPVSLHPFGPDVTGVGIHWQSSDLSTIAVTADGEAFGLRLGSATITAEMDGVIGTLVVTVVP